MGPSKFRVLVVDDFELFRRLLCSIVQNRPDVEIIGETANGLEAVRIAEELQPELILLDVGLPALNGIEAARQIRKLSPDSKLLFVSQQSSSDVVKEAFRAGASGFVLKSAVRTELPAALSAVLRGDKFVGSRFAGHVPSGMLDPGPASPPGTIRRPHEALFYSDDASFLDGFTQVISKTLEAGSATIVLATEPHRNGLASSLRARGIDISGALEQGRYISMDAPEALSTFMVDGQPNLGRLQRVITGLVLPRSSKGGRSSILACGECAALLVAQGRVEAAIQLEKLWNEVAKTCDLTIFCGYPVSGFQGLEGSYSRDRICAEHSAIHVR